MDIEALIVEPTVTLLPQVGDYKQQAAHNGPGDTGTTHPCATFTTFTGAFTSFTGAFTSFTGAFTTFTGQ